MAHWPLLLILCSHSLNNNHPDTKKDCSRLHLYTVMHPELPQNRRYLTALYESLIAIDGATLQTHY